MTNTMSPRYNKWCRCVDGRWHPWVLDTCEADEPEEGGDVVPVTPILGAALDQMYLQRRLMAVAASRIEGIATQVRMSGVRRDLLLALAEQLRKTVRGNKKGPLLDVGSATLQAAMDRAGWDGNLTRSRWEQETFGDRPVTW